MPELPEVETIKRDLETRILKKKISKVWVDEGFVKKISPDVATFFQLLKGKVFNKISRRAKLIYIEISNKMFLLIHLKMTGQLVFQAKKGELTVGGHPIVNVTDLPNKFTRVIIEFSDKSKLFFNDIRKFGYLKIVDQEGLDEQLLKTGVEPFDREYKFEYLLEIMKRRSNLKIKTFLLEQKLLAGLGNIYADEVCFLSEVKPTRRVKTLKKSEKELIFKYIKKVLAKAIKHRGTSFNTYVDSDGKTGGYQQFLKVYGRQGESCLRCKKGVIEKQKINGRSSSFCPHCQK
ncbi:bifunctional DNA-formamidopyrimidine glycosylase/DNA-(apurinic or apyrimidinic site) lyase [Candidatus Falkowbacteria bacterium]|jgi:formamidopyrimidine-DNA glycosylase|nr:bifunctional DNA-formamidopyrimidine glycosylase/DNA-(apurinic or apyrimidinic site) lyase [Candidatus Falkowbacteria bacterium]MBT7007193.1 bifunctional DNA-formamidopyrimidine glycosylase/DNA-(apurinic or apyrimidinic site) lyase [Candidatus Falkowbacteria bacterium]